MVLSRVHRSSLALSVLALIAAAPCPGGDGIRGGTERFVDLCLGHSFPCDSDLRIRQPSLGNDYTLEGIGFDDDSFDDPLWYSARAGIGLKRPSWLAVSAELIHAKIYARTKETKRLVGSRGGESVDGSVRVDSLVQRFDATHGLNHLMLDLLARRRLLRQLDLRVGAGVGLAIVHPENRIDGRGNRPRYEIAGVGVQGFIGVRAMVYHPLGLLAEYKFTRSDIAVDLASGEALFSERTQHLALGLTAVWGPP